MPQVTQDRIRGALGKIKENIQARSPDEIINISQDIRDRVDMLTGRTSPTSADPPQPIAIDQADAQTPPVFEPASPPDDLSLKAQVEQQRRKLEEMHQAQLEQVNKQLEEARKREQEAMARQKETLDQVDPLTQPFREDIERAERERLKVEENYFQNQALVEELDRLLTESIEMTRKLQTQRVPGLAGLQQSDRMIKAQENVQGRIAVIEAVMSARSNQIGTALNFIDRTKNSIQADRQDRLNYLETLFNFYETTRTEAGQKIFNLTQEQKQIFEEQKSLVRKDLERAEAVADTIREIMLDNPQMAAEAGLSLGDTEEEIVKKMADWQYNTEVREMKNNAEAEGLKYLTPTQAETKSPERVFTQIDSKGIERHFELPLVTKEKDWDLRTVGGNLYRVDKSTGERELLISPPTPAPTRTPTTTPTPTPTQDIKSFQEVVSELEGDIGRKLTASEREQAKVEYDKEVKRMTVPENQKAKNFFTKTQLSTGAARAGISISEFEEMHRDEANKYVRGIQDDTGGSTPINPFSIGEPSEEPQRSAWPPEEEQKGTWYKPWTWQPSTWF